MSAVARLDPVPEIDEPRHLRDIRFEFVDGGLMERAMGTESSHVGGVIYALLLDFSFRTKIGKTHVDGVGYRCFADDSKRVRKPDVSWFSAGRWRPEYSKTRWIEVAPDLVVEVLSPNDNSHKTTRKIKQFFTAGIKEAWIVHPHVEEVERRFADGAARWYGKDEVIDAAPLIPGFSWTLADVLAKA